MPCLFFIFGGYEFQALMDVVNSTEHMSNEGVKDAEYLTKQFIHVMQKIYPKYELFDMVVLDGAVNLQKEGQAIAARFHKSSSFKEQIMYVLVSDKGIQRPQPSASEEIHCHNIFFHFILF